MSKLFLGGTCNNSKWRERLIPQIRTSFFNPVVQEWDEKAQQRERHEREISEYCVYVITPLMTGVYAIAEVVEDSNKRPFKTIFCVLSEDEGKEFEPAMQKSLEAVKKMVRRNGSRVCETFADLVAVLNNLD